jgi:hypothetical protein
MAKPIYDKPRPKSLGKPKKLTPSQKARAKALAKKAGRPYPNMVDNIRVAGDARKRRKK